MFGFGKGDTNSLTMNKAHPDSLLDRGVQDVIGKPLDRVDGPKKVSGKATYAAEYALDNVAYGYLVRATVGAGKIKNLDAEAAKAMPGDRESSLAAGASDYVTKPVDLDELLATIASWVAPGAVPGAAES